MSDDINLEEVNLDATPADKTSPEDWNNLAGSTQQRIEKLARVKNEALDKATRLEEENARLRAQTLPLPPAPQQPEMSEDEQRAMNRMREVGVATTADIDRIVNERMKDVEARSYVDRKHSELKSKYSGSEYPSYNSSEIEAHMRDKGLYDPETAYRDLYWDELVEVEANKKHKSNQPYSEKTRSRIAGQEPMTPELLSQKLRNRDGSLNLEYYKKNEKQIKQLQKEWRE